MREAFLNRLKKNHSHRAKWARKHGIEAFRLYHHDIPEFPFIIDCYGPYFVVWNKLNPEKDMALINKVELLKVEIIDIFGLNESDLIWKERKVQKRDDRYHKLSRKDEFIEIREGDRRYLCNLWDYLDTGLFLDMRTQRDLIQEQLKPRTMLNLFSYTCSVGVAATLGGAKTCNVDLSNTYLDWGIENYRLNNLNAGEHRFLAGSCLDFVSEKPSEHFDLIFLDPPTFSNSKKMENDFDIVKDHVELIQNTAKWLTKEGTLLFSTNKKKFKLEEEIQSEFLVKETTGLSIPQDFKNSAIHKSYQIKKRP